ncbi:MAG: alpha-hydroxy-acid oxidizing protein, partial [Acidimicrobiales bacterium]
MSIFKTLRSVMRFKPIELDGNKRRLTKVANVEEFRVIAKKRLPRAVFDYIDGAAEDERTMGRNASKFSEIEFVPKVLVAVEHINT